MPGRRAERDVAPRRRELQGVSQQVEEHLPQPERVRLGRRQAALHLGAQHDPPVVRLDRQWLCDLLEQRAEIDGLRLEPQAPALELRQVEDVVDQGKQAVAAGHDVADILCLRFVEAAGGALGQELGETDHRVERRHQLVAHVGEQGALGQADALGFFLGAQDLGLGFLPLGDVARDAGDPVRHAAAVAHREGAVGDPPYRAVGAQHAVLHLPAEMALGVADLADPRLVLRVHHGEPGRWLVVETADGSGPQLLVGGADVHHPRRLDIEDVEDVADVLGELAEAFRAELADLPQALGLLLRDRYRFDVHTLSKLSKITER